ncbi:aminotransferase class V-fold PLP-dependent enzyme [Sphingomonas sp. CFBP 13706]|uniref:aminotransferase class V-fold PLP-dependent enzyme n=1 Tax=Sphingomonas sp. CFBP 13706 TaxID=2775314 RepID=UPI001FD33941|nr:aminotransferase class V-fold PLP-dependent enzyme [Sphingomonas sp. CFBP 13706]
MKMVGGTAAGTSLTGALPVPDRARDDVAARYDVDRRFANFDAAYYGPMTSTVAATYRRHGEWVNRNNAVFLRSALPGPSRDDRLQQSTDSVAGLIGARTGEVALCGGGTEALYGLIVNYRPLRAGEAVITADVDYDEMQHAMAYLASSRGAQHVRLVVPEPSTTANILAVYAKALREAPRARLILLTHVSNRNGLVLPVREIAAMARRQGVDVILDSAQSVGLLPVDVDDLGIDFMGFSLHKWVAAPLGTGALYIRRERLGDVTPWLGNHIHEEDDIRARVPTGTIDFAARLTIPTAVAEHRAFGQAHKLENLRAKREQWTSGVRSLPGLQLVHSEEPGLCAVIGAFRLPGQKGWNQARAAQRRFIDKHQVLVVAKQGLASGPVLRVTPSLFNTDGELERLVDAIRAEHARVA